MHRSVSLFFKGAVQRALMSPAGSRHEGQTQACCSSLGRRGPASPWRLGIRAEMSLNFKVFWCLLPEDSSMWVCFGPTAVCTNGIPYMQYEVKLSSQGELSRLREVHIFECLFLSFLSSVSSLFQPFQKMWKQSLTHLLYRRGCSF